MAQGEPEIDSLLAGVALLRQMREGTERLLEIPPGLAVGRPCQGLLSRLSAVRQGLLPHLTPYGMVGQAFDVFHQASRGERFKRRDDAGMERASPLLEQTAVGHFVRQGMLEGVGMFWEETGFIQKLGGLQMREATIQRIFGYLSDRLK